MKIGIVCYPTYGGSGVLATELGIALAKQGHQIHFITYKKPARLNSYFNNIVFHEVSSINYPLFEYQPYETSLTSKIVDVALFEKLDLIHVHYAIPHASVAYFAKQVLLTKGVKIPVVTTLHGTDITLIGIDNSFAPVVEFSINNSEAVTAVSHSLSADTQESFNVNKEIDVIHNFIDLERFRRIEHKSFRKIFAPDDEKIIIHTSNFRKVKKVDSVILAFKEITKEVNAKLLMIGDGPERQSMEKLCRELGVCQDIRFLGKQDAVEEILSIGDLFFLPSLQESFGLSALEAMACEVPVISSNVGGLPEVNINGETGFTSDVNDIDDMVKNALILLKDENKLNLFRANALKKAQEFDKANIVPQYEKVYNRIVAG